MWNYSSAKIKEINQAYQDIIDAINIIKKLKEKEKDKYISPLTNLTRIIPHEIYESAFNNRKTYHKKVDFKKLKKSCKNLRVNQFSNIGLPEKNKK